MRLSMFDKRVFKTTTLIITLTLLSSCGWHLRGSQSALSDELKTVRINTSQEDKSLFFALKRALKSAEATIVETPDISANNLNINKVSKDRRSVSTSSRGKTTEYTLISRINFSVTDKMKQELLAPITVSVERTYFFDKNSVASAFEEEQILRKEMQRDLIQQIIRRYRAIKVDNP